MLSNLLLALRREPRRELLPPAHRVPGAAFKPQATHNTHVSRGDKVFLAPVDAVWALRPSLEHLDAARPQPRTAEPPKEEEKPMLTALQASARASEPHQALPLL